MITKGQNIFIEWLSWHFCEIPLFLLQVWKNYIMFALNYFSLPTLLKSLFAPWRRYSWNYPRGFDVGEFFSTLISNLFSRLLGALVRISLIFIGVLFQIFVILAGIVIVLLWTLLPLIIMCGFLFFFSY